MLLVCLLTSSSQTHMLLHLSGIKKHYALLASYNIAIFMPSTVISKNRSWICAQEQWRNMHDTLDICNVHVHVNTSIHQTKNLHVYFNWNQWNATVTSSFFPTHYKHTILHTTRSYAPWNNYITKASCNLNLQPLRLHTHLYYPNTCM
jgi:hypothetical protein